MTKKNKKSEWVVYPEVMPTIDDLKKHFNMPSKENDSNLSSILTPEKLEKFITPELPEEPIKEKTKKITESEEKEEELTEEEQRERLIKALKDSKKNYQPKKLFNAEYKKERKRKNKQQKKSRKLNRK
jgi:hypothetical protein